MYGTIRAWAAFDDDDFCKALSGKASELASKLLVTAVLAFALVCMRSLLDTLHDSTDIPSQRLYVYFDAEVTHHFSTAHEEAKRLWQASIDAEDDSIATAAAGVIVYMLYAADGGECLSVFQPRLCIWANVFRSMFQFL